MMMHSKGPWDFVYTVSYTSGEHPEPDYEYSRISSESRFNIAIIYPDSEEWRDNSRLIAAAPDLLAACEAAVEAIDECLRWLKPDQGFGVVEAHENIKAAIAKAKP